MELATTQSVLMQIQPTIQRFARMLASVLQLEVEIVDENLCRVAGTGAYGKFLGRQLSGNSRLLRHVLHPAVPTGQAAPPAELLVKALLFVVHGMFLHFFIYCSFILKQWSL